MPQLPPITAPTPYSVVPTQTTEFNELFMTKLQIVADPTTAWTAILNFRNFSYANSQLAPDTLEANHQLVINDLLSLAGRSSMAAQVFGGLLMLAGLLYQEEDIIRRLAAATIPLTAAQSQLSSDQKSLATLTDETVILQQALDDANALPDDSGDDDPYVLTKAEEIALAQENLDANTAEITSLNSLIQSDTNAVSSAQSVVDSINAELAVNGLSLNNVGVSNCSTLSFGSGGSISDDEEGGINLLSSTSYGVYVSSGGNLIVDGEIDLNAGPINFPTGGQLSDDGSGGVVIQQHGRTPAVSSGQIADDEATITKS
jgi:hypothetical protein